MPATALIILNYNNPQATADCLRSVRAHNSAPVKTIVVDNASRPELRAELTDVFRNEFGPTAPIVEEHDLQSRTALHGNDAVLLLRAENSGYAQGNNAGLALAFDDTVVDTVMILNNDILFVEDIIPGLLEVLDAHPDAAVVSPVLYKKDMQGLDLNCARRAASVGLLVRSNLLRYWWRFRNHTPPGQYILCDKDAPTHGVIPMDLPSGSCMLLRKEVFARMGGFDPATFLYFEEDILAARAKKLGLRSYLSLDHRCIHLGAATTSLPTQHSYTILKAGIESACHYVDRYSGASAPMRLLHRISCHILILQFRIQKGLGIRMSK